MGTVAASGMLENDIGSEIIRAAFAVHSGVGPGLLESAYQRCLRHELEQRGLFVREQVLITLRYGRLIIENGYRVDLLVNDLVVIELKAIEAVHRGQLLSYLRLGGFKLGYLLNFNVAHMRQGITRLVNGL